MCFSNLSTRTFGAFNSPVYRHHQDAMELTVLPDVNMSSSPTNDSTVDISLGDSITEESTGNVTFVIQNGASYPTSLTAATRIQQLAYMDSQTQKESAKFLMKLSQRHHLLDDHFNSYVITPSISSCYVNIRDLPIRTSLLSHKSYNETNKNLYISLPHYLCD